MFFLDRLKCFMLQKGKVFFINQSKPLFVAGNFILVKDFSHRREFYSPPSGSRSLHGFALYLYLLLCASGSSLWFTRGSRPWFRGINFLYVWKMKVINQILWAVMSRFIIILADSCQLVFGRLSLLNRVRHWEFKSFIKKVFITRYLFG